jgi:hypothetical protein
MRLLPTLAAVLLSSSLAAAQDAPVGEGPPTSLRLVPDGDSRPMSPPEGAEDQPHRMKALGDQCLELGGFPWRPRGCVHAEDLNKAFQDAYGLHAGTTPPPGAKFGWTWLDRTNSPKDELKICIVPTAVGCGASGWITIGVLDEATLQYKLGAAVITTPRRTVTAGVLDVATATDSVINWNSADAGPKQQQIPTCDTTQDSRSMTVKDERGTVSFVVPTTVQPISGTIDGQASIKMTRPRQSLTLQCDAGTNNWNII